MAKGGKSGDKAGRNDTPKNVKEGRNVERDEKRINEANRADKTAAEKFRDLLKDD